MLKVIINRKFCILVTTVLLIFVFGCMHREVSARNIVLKSKTERVEQALYELNRQKIGAVGWKTIFSGNDTIVNNGGDYLIVFKRKDDSFQIDNALNLRDIDAHYVQGDICTLFLFNKEGSKVIINNSDTNTNKKHNVYYFDMLENKLKILSQNNINTSKGTWSPNSNFFSLVDTDRIIIFNTQTEKIKEIHINHREIKSILVSNSGDILFQADNTYLLTAKTNYNLKTLNISGSIISFVGNQILYYSSGNIYEYNNNQPVKKTSVGSSYNLYYVDSIRAIFSDGNNTLAYDIDRNEIYHYAINYNDIYRPNFSPDSKRCLVEENGFLKVISCNGVSQIIEEVNSSEFYGEYCWLDDNTLIRTIQKDHSMVLGDFNIERKVID